MRTTALVIFVALSTSAALAAPKKRAPAPPPEIAGLDSDDPAVVRESIEALGMAGTNAAGEAVTARLERGLDRPLTLVALDALAVLAHAPSADVVRSLTRHRDPSIRLRAVQTLVALEPADLRGTLERGLDDLDPDVRAECARALSEFGDRGSVSILFRAFERGELAAAKAIAALGDGPAIRRLTAYLGRVPFTAMSEPITRVLTRTDLEERLRLDVVGKLVELATPEVKYFLEDLGGALPGPANDPVKRAVNDAAFRIVD